MTTASKMASKYLSLGKGIKIEFKILFFSAFSSKCLIFTPSSSLLIFEPVFPSCFPPASLFRHKFSAYLKYQFSWPIQVRSSQNFQETFLWMDRLFLKMSAILEQWQPSWIF